MVFLIGSFVGTLAVAPLVIQRLKQRGFLVPDMYKSPGQYLVTHLGLLVLGIAVLVLVYTFLERPPLIVAFLGGFDGSDPLVIAQLALFTICGYGIFGAFDDRHSLSHITKGAIPFTLGLPLVLVTAPDPFTEQLAWIPFLSAAQLQMALLVVIPLYVLVITNLVNMHSGYNGLQSGLVLILLGTILLRATLEGKLEYNLPLMAIGGSVGAIYLYNRYPAKAIEGNVGSFVSGAAIGVGLAINGYLLAGVVMLGPHILDFSLFLFTKVTRRPFLKFGSVRSDGTIEAPYPYKLKFLLPYYFRLTERETVRLLHILTLACCAASFLIAPRS